jgi:hypothetical protein
MLRALAPVSDESNYFGCKDPATNPQPRDTDGKVSLLGPLLTLAHVQVSLSQYHYFKSVWDAQR